MLSADHLEDSGSKAYLTSEALLHTVYGDVNALCFSWGAHEEDNILCVHTSLEQPLLIRIHSACCTGEVLRSLDCDCYDQLQESLKRIVSQGGLLFYLFQEGRGGGIYAKIKAMGVTNAEDRDIVDLQRSLAITEDARGYERVVEILRHLNISSVRLLTNNPAKVKALTDRGVLVTREAIEINPTEWSMRSLKAKKEKLGHILHKLI